MSEGSERQLAGVFQSVTYYVSDGTHETYELDQPPKAMVVEEAE